MVSNEDIIGFRRQYNRILADKAADALRARNFDVRVCENSEEARKAALSLMPEGSTVGWGGSMTLEQIGLLDAVKTGNYNVLDRSKAGTPDGKGEIARKMFSADFFLTGFNAVSLDGTVFNVDGVGNRVAAITFGPKNVIAVIGTNKICHTDNDASERALSTAAELNAVRFGQGNKLFTDEDISGDNLMEGRICNFIEQISWCNPKGRIKIIIVPEDLGF